MLCQSAVTHLNVSHDRKQLYQFLDFCRQKAVQGSQRKIASIALEIDAVDPLAVLQHLSRSDQLHFYIENRDQNRAIAAINTAVVETFAGSQRFFKTHQLIETTLENLISSSPVYLNTITPYFFCSFTFSEQAGQTTSTFPDSTVFLPELQIMRWQKRSVALVNRVIAADCNIEQLTQAIWRQFQTLRSVSYPLFPLANELPPFLRQWQVKDASIFPAAVRTALDAIAQQRLHKVVLAHALDVTACLPFDWVHSLHNLRQSYPDCYVFSVGNGQGENFIGASPERLLTISRRRLITDALAGTAPRGRTMAQDASLAQRLFQNAKERHEHQVVVDFIVEQLTALGLNPTYERAPSLLKLSNLQHLHTPIQALLPAELPPLEILAALHPTPAVAGFPSAIARQYIQQLERLERSLYAAPLGWVDAQGNAEFVVGIRSALLRGNSARLYAGAGIVAGSEPEREFAEVKLKLQALLRALV
jgi:menaquinone-specific isochorismate synthase